jgi:hypothetical protein
MANTGLGPRAPRDPPAPGGNTPTHRRPCGREHPHPGLMANAVICPLLLARSAATRARARAAGQVQHSLARPNRCAIDGVSRPDRGHRRDQVRW